MEKYICNVCATVYNPDLGEIEDGIQPGTKFEDLPEDWKCVICGSGKEHFEILSEEKYEKMFKR